MRYGPDRPSSEQLSQFFLNSCLTWQSWYSSESWRFDLKFGDFPGFPLQVLNITLQIKDVNFTWNSSFYHILVWCNLLLLYFLSNKSKLKLDILERFLDWEFWRQPIWYPIYLSKLHPVPPFPPPVLLGFPLVQRHWTQFMSNSHGFTNILVASLCVGKWTLPHNQGAESSAWRRGNGGFML